MTVIKEYNYAEITGNSFHEVWRSPEVVVVFQDLVEFLAWQIYLLKENKKLVSALWRLLSQK